MAKGPPPWATPGIFGIRKAYLEDQERRADERERYNRKHGIKNTAPLPPPSPPKPKPKPPPSTFYVRVDPGRGFARLHRGECHLARARTPPPEHYRPGAYWTKGFAKFRDANAFMAKLDYADAAPCPRCGPD